LVLVVLVLLMDKAATTELMDQIRSLAQLLLLAAAAVEARPAVAAARVELVLVEVLEEALVKIVATTTEQLELRTKVMVVAQVQFHLQAVRGGGGGAGAAGADGAASEVCGAGGAGVSSSITGSAVTRGGGGGGASNGQRALGGAGGGGDGGGPSSGTVGNPGTANTGGGGGGGNWSNANGGAGGSGVVILSIPTTNYSGTTTGSPTVTTSGANTILTFTGSGSYTA
jgi:hypothetical protein